MGYVETAWDHANIPADLAGLRPLGDFVLVRVLPEEEMHKNLIWLPQFSGAHADRARRPIMPSIGEVIAAGPGDRLKGKRAPMHVSAGDRVLYWRVPANEVVINDETFQFLHEEQHVIGVIEQDDPFGATHDAEEDFG